MIYLQLFLVFLEVGAVSFGGGYAMIALIREKVLAYGWLEEENLLNIVAIAESTPGPIAVNMATFVGSTQGGFLGALLATLGVVLPSFLVILAIAIAIRGFLKYKGVKAFLSGVRPCVIALIIGTSLTLALTLLLGMKSGIFGGINPDIKGILLLALLFIISHCIDKITGKKPSAILMVGISAVMGVILYGMG